MIHTSCLVLTPASLISLFRASCSFSISSSFCLTSISACVISSLEKIIKSFMDRIYKRLLNVLVMPYCFFSTNKPKILFLSKYETRILKSNSKQERSWEIYGTEIHSYYVAVIQFRFTSVIIWWEMKNM